MPHLRVQGLSAAERNVSIDRDVLTFGRSSSSDLVLDVAGVSRRHGRVCRDALGCWWVEDLQSKNGVFVDGERVTRKRLEDGDTVLVGAAALTFFADARPATSMLTISEPTHPSQVTLERDVDSLATVDRARLQVLCGIAGQLLDQRSVDGLIDQATDALVRHVGADVVVFGLTCDPDREPHQLVTRTANDQETNVVLSRSVLNRTIHTKRALLISQATSDRSVGHAHSIVVGGIRSAMCVPLTRDRDVTGFLYLDSRGGAKVFEEDDLEFAGAVAGMVGIAVENARLHEADLAKERMAAELASARQVQEAILPSAWPVLEGWFATGHHETCYEVGGDYYDAIATTDDRLWLLVADVVGKGAPAALLASSIHAAVHVLVDQCDSPAELLHHLNALLLRRDFGERFVTCLVGLIGLSTGDVVLASAGHPPPFFVSPGSCRELSPPRAYPLGVARDVEYGSMPWCFPSCPGALLMYSDGVVEALNHQGEQFGEARLLEALSAEGLRTPGQVVGALRKAIQEFRGQRDASDDLTVLALGRD